MINMKDLENIHGKMIVIILGNGPIIKGKETEQNILKMENL